MVKFLFILLVSVQFNCLVIDCRGDRNRNERHVYSEQSKPIDLSPLIKMGAVLLTSIAVVTILLLNHGIRDRLLDTAVFIFWLTIGLVASLYGTPRQDEPFSCALFVGSGFLLIWRMVKA